MLIFYYYYNLFSQDNFKVKTEELQLVSNLLIEKSAPDKKSILKLTLKDLVSIGSFWNFIF